jgi:hypothetical protein
MILMSSSEEHKKVPIYPPEINKAILYFAVSFLAFLVATWYMIPLLVVLTGIAVACASAQLGEQLYKKNIWKEVLYWRTLGNQIEEE